MKNLTKNGEQLKHHYQIKTMIFLHSISLYITIGIIWSIWLESFTTRVLQAPYNQPWTNSERLFHITLWVYSFGVFIYNFVKDYFKNKPK